MKRIILKSIVAFLVAGVILSGCNEKKESQKIEETDDSGSKSLILRYAENQPQDYPTSQAAYKFAELVESKTEGRIHIEVYCNAQLGDEKSVISQLQFGAIDFTRVSISPLSEFDKSLNILQLPYLYKDAAQMWRVLDGEIGTKFLSNISSNNLIGLSWFDSGARNFYNSKRPVTCLEDLKGLRIRVQESRLMMGMIEAVGAEAVPMAYGDVYSSLQSGAIDGAENNWSSYDSSSHYEVAKYYVLNEHTRVPEMQMISKITWDKLSADDQKIIRECAEESAKIERKLWEEKEKASEAKIRASGAVITELTAAEKEKFQAAMDSVYVQFARGYETLISRIQAE